MQEALARLVGLNPFAVEYELWDATLARLCDDQIGCAWRSFNVDFGVGNRVLAEKAFSLAAVAAPVG